MRRVFGIEEESLFVCLCFHMQETVQWKTPIYQFIYVTKRVNFSPLTDQVCMTDAKLAARKQTDMTDLPHDTFQLRS